MTKTRQAKFLFPLLLGLGIPNQGTAQSESTADQRIAAILAEHGGGSIKDAIARLDALLATGKAPNGSLLATRYRLELMQGKRRLAATTLTKLAAMKDAKWRIWARQRAMELKQLDPQLPIDALTASPRLQALVNVVATRHPDGWHELEGEQVVRVGEPAVRPLISEITNLGPDERVSRAAIIKLLAEIGTDSVEAYFRERLADSKQPLLRSAVAGALAKLGSERRGRLAAYAIRTDDASVQRLGLLAHPRTAAVSDLDGLERVFEQTFVDADHVAALLKLPIGEPRVERWVQHALRAKARLQAHQYTSLFDIDPSEPALVGRLLAAMSNPNLSSLAVRRAAGLDPALRPDLPAKLLGQLRGNVRREYLGALAQAATVIPASLMDVLDGDLWGLAICWPKFPMAARESQEKLATQIVSAFGRSTADVRGARLELLYRSVQTLSNIFAPIEADIGRYQWRQAAEALAPLLQHPDESIRRGVRATMVHAAPQRLLQLELAVKSERPPEFNQLLADHGDRSMLDAMVAATPSQGFRMVARILDVAKPEDFKRLLPVALWVSSEPVQSRDSKIYGRWTAWLDQVLQPQHVSELLAGMGEAVHVQTLRIACERSTEDDVPALVRFAEQPRRVRGSSEHLARALVRHGASDQLTALAASQIDMLDALSKAGGDTAPAWHLRVSRGLDSVGLRRLLHRPGSAKAPALRDGILAALGRGESYLESWADRVLPPFFANMDPKVAEAALTEWLAPLQLREPLAPDQVRPLQSALIVLGARGDASAIDRLGMAIRPDLDKAMIRTAILGLRRTFDRKAVPHLIRALRIDYVAKDAQITLNRLHEYFAEVERWQEHALAPQGSAPASQGRADEKKK